MSDVTIYDQQEYLDSLYEQYLEDLYEAAMQQQLDDYAMLAKAEAEFQSYLDDQEDEYPR